MGESALQDLADWADSQLTRLVAEAHAAVLARMPLYRKGRPVSHDELRRSIERNLGFLVSAVGAPESPLDLSVPQETGRRRALQSFPLPEVLQAYRISFATLWDALVDRARVSEFPEAEDELLTATGRIYRLTDEHALALTEAYRATTAELLLSQQQRRSALVEALLTGTPGAEAGPWEAASLLGLPPDAELVVVAAETRGLAEESIPGIERTLAGRGIASGWRLTPALQLGIVAVPPTGVLDLVAILTEVGTARTGISPPYRSIAETPRSLQLARAALATMPAGAPRVRVFDSSPLAALMAREPGEGERLAREVLGSVLALPEDDRGALLDTLHAYLDHEGSAELAATVLHCHPNTVRYRLRRLHELTGRSLADPHGLAELAAASYAVRMGPGVRSGSPGGRQRS